MELRQLAGLALAITVGACGNATKPTEPGVGGASTPGADAARGPLNPALIAQGKQIFRFETYGDESFWTDTLRLHQVIRSSVSPATALSVGLKVDVDALPGAVKTGLQAGTIDLND